MFDTDSFTTYISHFTGGYYDVYAIIYVTSREIVKYYSISKHIEIENYIF